MQFSVRPAALKVALDPQAAINQQALPGVTTHGENAEDEQTALQRKVDERNFDSKIGWREALAFEHPIKGWQNLWIRFATDLDIKKEDTKGENSRFYKFATRTSNKQFSRGGRESRTDSRFGSHPGDHKNRDRETTKISKKHISKPEKYRQGRRGRKDNSDDESSELDQSVNSKEQAGQALDDGQTRSEVVVNFISKSAGILKAETMQENAAASKDDGDDWGEESKISQ